MADRSLPKAVDALVVGNGPSALILSFILHGNIPYYNPSIPHPDPILHKKLSCSPCLLDINAYELTAHFAASRISYSTQALPINVLLDTLRRPLHDTEPAKHASCVTWRFEEDKAISHVVVGNAPQAGGQWADNPVKASWDIGALSYAEMLSLPGYTFEDHLQSTQGHIPFNFYFYRPTRREVASYLAAYPAAVGISDSIYNGVSVDRISRTAEGFHVGSHDIECKRLVLASGVFSRLIPPRAPLQPLADYKPSRLTDDLPNLVVGSGFTAADVILFTPPGQKIIHIFKWDPKNRPSPLKACHPRAYPEYWSVYRRMKLAVRAKKGSLSAISPLRKQKSNLFLQGRDWETVYEGLPNTYIKTVYIQTDGALLTLVTLDGQEIQRKIRRMDYLIGRRGALIYLNHGIRSEIDASEVSALIDQALVSGSTLRSRIERDFQLAPNVFAIGSLTGDSLIRFAFGGCIAVAQELLWPRSSTSVSTTSSSRGTPGNLSSAPSSPIDVQVSSGGGLVPAGGHPDLHLGARLYPKSDPPG